MAKGINKLTKLKSVLKKLNSFGKNNNHHHNHHQISNINNDDDSSLSLSASISRDRRAVYVGKSQRRYMVSSDVVEHPVFRELVGRSGFESEDRINVGCEVVLFEHLLWMLENAEPQHESSYDELVEYYAY